MAFTGYNIYRGAGGDSNVDYSSPVGSSVTSSVSLSGLGHDPNTRYIYVIRPVLNDLEMPDVSCRIEFVTDAQGNWTGNQPAAVQWLVAEAAKSAQVLLQWSYKTNLHHQPPESFRIYVSQTPEIIAGSPQQTIDYTNDGICSHTLSLNAGESYYFAISALSADSVESPIFIIAGPVTLTARTPPQPTAIFSITFSPHQSDNLL